ncbi:3-phosphoshikimate 1-carboxyvinyltransferase [Hydrocarboniphaga effusa]|jgi:3-phosphoshikimate 1-carboxyvinyltransferase|uniref:3-phosphoshikimate 1-carboxyvinyltransferase n=1 Tax=Hydrocarboniphaga effusa TaxID=243629 RepID=UPI003138435D
MSASPRTEFLDLAPIRAARGELKLPGSKSVSIRALLLAALSEGQTRLTGLLDSDDTRVMRQALKACGVSLEQTGDAWRVGGAGRFPLREADIFVGNSGLSVRTLVAVLAFMEGRYRLSGVPRMHERPIGDLVDALRPLGARIAYEQNEGFPPLLITPAQARTTQPVRVRGDASSQFLTGILQSAPLLAREHELVIEVEGELISKPYIELSIALMRRFGVEVQRSQTATGAPRFTVAAGSRYSAPGNFAVEGDASSASYFLALGALAGGPIRIHGMGLTTLQGDVRFVDVVAAMGAHVTQGDDWTEVRSAGLAAGFRPKAFDTDFNHIPDAAMTAAVLALFADGPSVLRNIGSWRVKETDRIAAMATELAKLGAEVEAGPDFLRVVPPPALKPATIDTYDDHRMAMCFSLAACGGVPVRINDPGCVAKTFPDYFLQFAALTSGSTAG